MVPSVGLLDSGLMGLVLEPQPGHYVGSLGRDSLAPHIPPPGVQMGTNKRPGKPHNMGKYQISWGKGSFCPLSLFPSLSRNKIQDGDGNARRESFDPVPIKLAKNQSNILGVASTKVSFDKSFCTLRVRCE